MYECQHCKDYRQIDLRLVAFHEQFCDRRNVTSVGVEFIAHDWAGWNENHGRFTHVPSGGTLLCRRYWGQEEWDKAQLDWLRQYDGTLTVHDCPGAYNTDGKLMGTVAEICERLEKRLSGQSA